MGGIKLTIIRYLGAKVDNTKKVDMQFRQETVGLDLIVHGIVDVKEVGVCRTDIGDKRLLMSDISIYERIEDFSRPLIEYVIGLFCKEKAAHCVYLGKEEIKKLKPICEELGFEEIEPNLLVAHYPI